MKKWILVLVLAAMLAGCNVYLPGDMQTALDKRLIELERAKQLYPAPDCAKVINADYEFLSDLKEAAQ